MPDITLCTNNTCTAKRTCYRFMAEPSEWQSYMAFGDIHGNKCSSFIEIGGRKCVEEEKDGV